MREFVAKAKTAILEEMANFDSLTADMGPEQRNNIYALYLNKLQQMNEMEADIESRSQQNVRTREESGENGENSLLGDFGDQFDQFE